MKLIQKFEEKIFHAPDGCWYWLGLLDSQNRGRITVYGVNRVAAKVSFEIYKGEVHSGLHVLHTCDNSMCVNPNHLYLGTQEDNTRDMVQRLRTQRGEKHRCARLTKEQVLAIRASSETNGDLGRKYKVRPSSIWNIRHNKTWKHVL